VCGCYFGVVRRALGVEIGQVPCGDAEYCVKQERKEEGELRCGSPDGSGEEKRGAGVDLEVMEEVEVGEV
jgi:hypothetical protein